jgi:hypothetical protein
MGTLARTGFMRWLLGSGRTPAWDAADKRYHQDHSMCEMCGLPAGPLGPPFDTKPGNQTVLEAHDVLPYHKLTPAQQNDEQFIYNNFIMLHWFEHRRIAHCGDPNCLEYDPGIRDVAKVVLTARQNCTT